MKLAAIFRPDYQRYEGVRPFNVYFLRLLFLVVFVFLGKDAWTSLLTHSSSWDPYTTAAFCMWAAFALISLIGVLHPLKMLPLMGVTQAQFERDKLDCMNEVLDVLKVGGLKNYAAIHIECMKRKGYTYERQHLKPSEARKLSSN
jgi:hypothetical protein